MLRTLPDLTTTFCPKLYCLHHGLDELYGCLRADGGFPDPPLDGSYRPIPRYQEFLEIVYSRLLQDPLVSRTVSVIYAGFWRLSPRKIEELLGLTPGELRRSTAMQGLFGPGFREGDNSFIPLRSLGILLKMGRVKFRPSQDYRSEHIDDHMSDAHECLAVAYARLLPGGDEYVWAPWSNHWSDHLGYAKPSERLFEMLRWVSIRAFDVMSVIRWLEKSPNVPRDVLARWRAARVELHDTNLVRRRPRICILDIVFEEYYRLARLRRNRNSDLEMETRTRTGNGT
ncbi:hypothetical protein BD779DRAFT_519594 [Infundibulicybe gibba]|nr:hypothetical protein BD779DRAFT_519594 [Infundibulicybe gibba]